MDCHPIGETVPLAVWIESNLKTDKPVEALVLLPGPVSPIVVTWGLSPCQRLSNGRVHQPTIGGHITGTLIVVV